MQLYVYRYLLALNQLYIKLVIFLCLKPVVYHIILQHFFTSNLLCITFYYHISLHQASCVSYYTLMFLCIKSSVYFIILYHIFMHQTNCVSYSTIISLCIQPYYTIIFLYITLTEYHFCISIHTISFLFITLSYFCALNQLCIIIYHHIQVHPTSCVLYYIIIFLGIKLTVYHILLSNVSYYSIIILCIISQYHT